MNQSSHRRKSTLRLDGLDPVAGILMRKQRRFVEKRLARE
jgi:hypothetical protein